MFLLNILAIIMNVIHTMKKASISFHTVSCGIKKKGEKKVSTIFWKRAVLAPKSDLPCESRMLEVELMEPQTMEF